MNKIILIGNLTKDPQKKYVKDDMSVCTFSIAVNRRFKQQEVDFFNITAFGKMGDNCYEYLKTGSKVSVLGSVQINNYEQEGVKKTYVSVLADEVEFLSSRSSDNQGQSKSKLNEAEPIDDDEQPF